MGGRAIVLLSALLALAPAARAADCRESIASLEEQFKASPSPSLLLQIAECRRRTKNFAAATEAYLNYLRLYPDDSRAGDVREWLEEVESAQRRERRARATRPANPPAEKPAAKAIEKPPPVARPAPAPPVEKQQAAVEPPAPAPPPPAPAPPPVSPPQPIPEKAAAVAPPPKPAPPPEQKPFVVAAAPAAVAAPVKPSRPAPAPVEAERSRTFTWVAAGAAAVALGAGGFFGLQSKSTSSQINDPNAAVRSTQQLDDLQSQYKSQAHAANVLFAVGAGLAVVSATFFVLRF